ncbi:FkbM family methyltransferase [Roseovarius sp.]|uniref:FkbM family methyltransferase n=1 Tax=Roseovarius sp. TaxID=1486281 RepID=UPI00262717F0|nr:FkbM family methyltransferase [Roseovarius sp.]
MGKSNATLFVIRAQRFDALARILAERLNGAGEAVAVVVDERRGLSDCAPYRKISLGEAALADIGLTGLPDDWGWFCGDLCYYLAADRFPDFARYCLIESDVYLPINGVDPFVAAMNGHPSEAIAAQLGPTDRPREFFRDLTKLGLDPAWGCIFPVSRISANVLMAMKDLRRETLEKLPNARLNDEAMLAGAIQRGGFTFASLESVLPHQVDRSCFETNPPHLYEAIAANATEVRLFHPVVTFDTAMERIATGAKNYSLRRLRNVLDAAPDPMKQRLTEAVRQSRKAGKGAKKETLSMNALFTALNIGSPVRILDVGANPLIEGEVSYQRLLDQGHAEVVGFEPQQEALAALNARKSEREHYLPIALGDGAEHVFHSFRSPGFNSLYAGDPASAAYLGFGRSMTEVGSEMMKTDRLDDLEAVPQVDFLKIDVQGSETTILENGRSKLSEASVVQTEVRMFPIYKDEPRYGDLQAELARQGFEFLRFVSLKHACLARSFQKRLKRHSFAQAIDGDAFFVRDLRKVDQYTDERLKKLAVIADSIIQNYDLALYALEVLHERGSITVDLVEWYFTQVPASHRRA